MMLPINRRSALSGVALSLAAVAAGGVADAQPLTTINVTTTPTESGMQVYYAEERGFFKAVGPTRRCK